MSTNRQKALIYLMSEAAASLNELGEIQPAPTTTPTQQPQPPAVAPPTQPAPTPPVAPTGGDGGQHSVDTVVDHLNVIRGGKSFSEPEVYKALSDYYNTVAATEREIVDKFLVGVGKVITNTPSEAAPAPANAQVSSQPPMQQTPPQGGGSASPPASAPVSPGV